MKGSRRRPESTVDNVMLPTYVDDMPTRCMNDLTEGPECNGTVNPMAMRVPVEGRRGGRCQRCGRVYLAKDA